jgi:ATP-binding cassette subfamily B multidrug efflux pump
MKPLFYLNKYLWKYKWRLFLGIIFIIISNIFYVEMPRIVKEAVNMLIYNIKTLEDSSSTNVVDIIFWNAIIASSIYVGYSLIKGFFLFLTRQTIIVMSRFIEYDLKNEIYSHYQKLSPSFYKKYSTGDLMNRISEDVSKVRMYLGPAIMYTINLLVLFVLTISYMLSTNVELTLYVLTPLPLMAVLIYYISKIMNKKSEVVQVQQSEISSFVQETFSGIRVIKAYNMQNNLNGSFKDEAEVYKIKSMDLAMVNALFFPVMILLIGISTIVTIYVGGIKANEGAISTGDIAAFVIYVNMLTWPFASVGWVTSMVQRASASQKRINEFLNQEPEIVNVSNPKPFVNGNIKLQSVSYTYEDSGIKALNNISLTIPEGETLGVIGETGSGKSTFVNLLGRLFDASEGNILINNENIKNINLKSLKHAIGYVPQDSFLFSDTISNNIQFGFETNEMKEEIMLQAAKDAHIYNNIIDFKEGFETLVGERGVTLSGGQKQRVSIARAIIKEPQILILDDCLSAVDTETEDIILNNLKRIMKNKTSIIISHRISSVQNADNIIVFQNGEIIEQGNHQKLMSKASYYKTLYEKQMDA